MSKKINNKNAREKALLEEAYGNVYKEEFNPRRDAPSHKRGDPHPATRAAEDIVDREVMWGRYSGVVDEVDVERGVAWVITDDDGGLHEVELGNFDHIGDKREREDEENPNARTYDKQGEENPFAVTADARDEEEEYTAEQHAKGIKMAIEALGFIEAELPTDYEENINVNELKGAHDHLSKALHWLLDETDVDYIMGREEVQEYDMDLDPQGRREADPREY